MDNFVEIREDFFINLEEALKIEGSEGSYGIHMRDGASVTVHYCHADSPGYGKLKKLLAKARR